MLESSLLWYKKLRSDLESHGFKFNPYDPCIANKTVNGKQQTIRFHVDDLLSSHVDPKVNDAFYKWMNDTYGSIKAVTCTIGDKHTYLGMTLDFSKKGKVKIRMDEYVQRMLDDFPVKFKEDEKQETPAASNLLEVEKAPNSIPRDMRSSTLLWRRICFFRSEHDWILHPPWPFWHRESKVQIKVIGTSL